MSLPVATLGVRGWNGDLRAEVSNSIRLKRRVDIEKYVIPRLLRVFMLGEYIKPHTNQKSLGYPQRFEVGSG